MAASTESLNYVQKMFIAFLGRAGAPAGMEYYAALIDADEEEKKEQKLPFLLSSFAHELSAQNLHAAGAMQSGRDGFQSVQSVNQREPEDDEGSIAIHTDYNSEANRGPIGNVRDLSVTMLGNQLNNSQQALMSNDIDRRFSQATDLGMTNNHLNMSQEFKQACDDSSIEMEATPDTAED